MSYLYGEFNPDYKNGDWAKLDEYDELVNKISENENDENNEIDILTN